MSLLVLFDARRWLGLVLVMAANALTLAAVLLQDGPARAMAPHDAAVEQQAASRIFVRVFLRKGDKFESMIVAVDPLTGRWERVADGMEILHVRVSRDRRTVLFAKNEDGVWTSPVKDGSEPTRILYTGSSPIWSPDETEIIASDGKYEDGKGWKHSNWRVNIDGKNLKRLAIMDADGVVDWSPDGKWIVTVSDRHPPQGSGYQLYVMRPDGSEERRITQEGLNVYARFSPDSRRIVYTHQQKGFNSLWVVNVDGTHAHEILKEEDLEGVGAACWSPDGKQLVVQRYNWELNDKGQKIRTAGVDHDFRLEIIDADGKNPRTLRLEDLRPLDIGHPEWR